MTKLSNFFSFPILNTVLHNLTKTKNIMFTGTLFVPFFLEHIFEVVRMPLVKIKSLTPYHPLPLKK